MKIHRRPRVDGGRPGVAPHACPGPGLGGAPCGRPIVAHGLCISHYRQDRLGDPLRPVGLRGHPRGVAAPGEPAFKNPPVSLITRDPPQPGEAPVAPPRAPQAAPTGAARQPSAPAPDAPQRPVVRLRRAVYDAVAALPALWGDTPDDKADAILAAWLINRGTP